ncbi:DUF1796 family putative cysteine peptidase [Neotabrizicola sp. VNH66]|uniref:DUF1796 family putative cysteine peptidase n=1 Tax=Neotabrizicola sp. VNH66 TaxID=3400918 RepID=UPI003BFB1E8D
MLISMGSNCYVSWTFRKVGLQNGSYPLDWVNTFRFGGAIRFLQDFGPTLFNHLTPSEREPDRGKPNIYALDEYMIRLPHEHDVTPDITRSEIAEKYSRRMGRLKEVCRTTPHVIFVRAVAERCYDLPNETASEYSSEQFAVADSLLQELCGGRHFTLLLLHGSKGYFDNVAPHPRIRTAHLGLPFENGFFTANARLPQKQQAFDIFSEALTPLAHARSSEEATACLRHPVFKGAAVSLKGMFSD